MHLALGTVQFGLAYGVAGNTQAVSADETRLILKRAHEMGIRMLDTAAAYGDIEARLSDLCGDLDFEIVSKIPAVPQDITDAQSLTWLIAQAEQSRHRLGARLKTLMFHQASDLTEARGDTLWSSLCDWGRTYGIAIGVSFYAPEAAIDLHARLGVSIAQLPGNALDQRLTAGLPADLTVHLRSVFLQGLLLLPLEEARRKVPRAEAALRTWHDWCEQQRTEPLIAALSVVKSFRHVQTCLVGVDSLAQLHQIGDAWTQAQPHAAPQLSCDTLDAIDPRHWSR